jgi:uncharacterized protein YbjT (DUF2867 family)
MNIALLGGTGFIGSYVAGYLMSKGYSVTIFTRNPEKHIPAASSARRSAAP